MASDSRSVARIMIFSYHNLDLGAFRVMMGLRSISAEINFGEINFGGATGFHGSWWFDNHEVQPFHRLCLLFNSRWPFRRELLGAELQRVSATEWHGHDYARRRVHVSHTDTYLRQPGGFWLFERTRTLVQDPMPAIQGAPMLAIQDQGTPQPQTSTTHARDTPDGASRDVRRRLS